ncbi:hypothetical protein FSP39_022375 [Pinctada imbricata]|uniref:THAP-type domain-containing protein n=1 Tax=Pinctada imbricata TaxID=66713 RepID=A0AA88YKG7_PINIB|nr:hypothetical protein FSP39_022375 [Pinctada imbricata]
MADSIEEKSRTLAKGKGRFCCAGGCTNTNADGVSLHSFPSEKRPDIRRKWIKFIRDEQINFVSPTKYQFICERHFTKECYPKKYSILEALGKHDEIKRKDLNPDAVPTIHLKPKRYLHTAREKNLPLSLGGDGRCDTPGHSAKFCSYTMLDVNLMVVADIQLVQSNEVKSSSHMEKEGLIRAVKEFQENGLAIGELVTDRHPQITKFVREEMPNTKHYFDVWHVAKGSKAFVELEKIAANTRIKKDIRKLSPGPQTAALEGYHSILNHFAPKMIGFSYEGMLSRLLLAALHFNENMQRPQACTREGAKRFSIIFPKAKGGHYSLKEVKEPSYVETLKDEMTRLAINGEGKRKDIQMPMAPPPLSASYFHPVKEDAINNFQSRFKLLP